MKKSCKDVLQVSGVKKWCKEASHRSVERRVEKEAL